MTEYAGVDNGAADVVEVKTDADSVSKQINACLIDKHLFSAIPAAVKRRDVAGNGTYICLHDVIDLSPQLAAGSTMKGAAGKMQCVRKSRPGVPLGRIDASASGRSERSSLKC